MKTKEIKKIEIQALEWFDKQNGNSYFSADIWINDEINLKIPFDYGYGNFYIQSALETIKENLNCFKKYKNTFYSLRTICDENKIELITNKKQNCKKSELNR